MISRLIFYFRQPVLFGDELVALGAEMCRVFAAMLLEDAGGIEIDEPDPAAALQKEPAACAMCGRLFTYAFSLKDIQDAHCHTTEHGSGHQGATR